MLQISLILKTFDDNGDLLIFYFFLKKYCYNHNTNANTAPMRISPKAVVAAGLAAVAGVAAASA